MGLSRRSIHAHLAPTAVVDGAGKAILLAARSQSKASSVNQPSPLKIGQVLLVLAPALHRQTVELGQAASPDAQSLRKVIYQSDHICGILRAEHLKYLQGTLIHTRREERGTL